jgi:PPK2 family polyphosphate:nucleotide phosphotransferase
MGNAIRISPGQNLSLNSIDPDADDGLSKENARERIQVLGNELEELQELLSVAGMNGLLIVVQGRDTAGKEGTIKSILDFSSVRTCNVAAFKVPTPLELSHDFLWRIHHSAPAKGAISIFNRSHYEDVLVVRVHEYVPKDVWSKRFEHINSWERLLTDSGTIVLKFMLHISSHEQERRLIDREKEVEKAWKLNVQDWRERELWDQYTEAYEEALTKCSPENAPWFVIPANKKWARDVAVLETIVLTLRPYRQVWLDRLEKIGKAAKEELKAFRTEKQALQKAKRLS